MLYRRFPTLMVPFSRTGAASKETLRIADGNIPLSRAVCPWAEPGSFSAHDKPGESSVYVKMIHHHADRHRCFG
jgi:hypothetical protein